MKKKVLIVFGGVVLVLGIFIWQVFSNLDSIVASVLEDIGSDVLKTKVSVSAVSIELKEAKAGIGGMTIANPDGWSSANLFDMEGVEVDFDFESMNSDVLIIESIRIVNPKIVFESNETGGNNMQTLLDNMGSGSDADTSEDAGKKTTKMIIESFEFSGGQVKASNSAKPGEVIELNLPAIKMKNIGKAEGGVPVDVVMEQITKKLVSKVLEVALKAEVNKAIEKQKKGFMDKLGEKLKGES